MLNKFNCLEPTLPRHTIIQNATSCKLSQSPSHASPHTLMSTAAYTASSPTPVYCWHRFFKTNHLPNHCSLHLSDALSVSTNMPVITVNYLQVFCHIQFSILSQLPSPNLPLPRLPSPPSPFTSPPSLPHSASSSIPPSDETSSHKEP